MMAFTGGRQHGLSRLTMGTPVLSRYPVVIGTYASGVMTPYEP